VLGEASSAAIGGLIAAIMIPLPIIIMGVILLMASFMVRKTNDIPIALEDAKSG